MSILTRYICRRLILYYFSFVIVLMAFFVFIDFMEHVKWITKYGAPLKLIGLYYIYFLPRVFVEISWMSFLVATLIVLGGLAKNNEFTAMLAGGISIYKIGIPTLAMGLLLTGGVFCVQEFLMPVGLMRANEMRESDFAQGPREHRIYDIAGIGRRNRFYSSDMMDVEKGILTGVRIHTKEGGSITERIDANEAMWNEEKGRWYLTSGVIRKFDANGVIMETTPFTNMKAPFKESPKELEARASGMGEFNFIQLRNQIKILERSGYDAQRLKVNYQVKFALPAANLIVVLLALPFALECRRGGLTIGFALSLTAALLYYGTFQIGLILGRGGFFPALVSAWLANLIFLGVGAGLTFRART